MDNLPMELRHMLLQYFTEPRDFTNVSLTCRAWREACVSVRWPMPAIKICHQPKNNDILDVFTYDHPVEALYTDALAYNNYFKYRKIFQFHRGGEDVQMTKFTPPGIVANGNFDSPDAFQHQALDVLAHLMKQYRVVKIYINLEHFNKFDLKPILTKHGIRLKCDTLFVAHATIEQINAFVSCVKSQNYSLYLRKSSKASIEPHQNLKNCNGIISLRRTVCEPQLIGYNFSSIVLDDIDCDNNTNNTLQHIEQWVLDWWYGPFKQSKKIIITDACIEKNYALNLFKSLAPYVTKSADEICYDYVFSEFLYKIGNDLNPNGRPFARVNLERIRPGVKDGSISCTIIVTLP